MWACVSCVVSGSSVVTHASSALIVSEPNYCWLLQLWFFLAFKEKKQCCLALSGEILNVLSSPSCSIDTGPAESPASLKRVASPAAKPAVPGEGEALSMLSSIGG